MNHPLLVLEEGNSLTVKIAYKSNTSQFKLLHFCNFVTLMFEQPVSGFFLASGAGKSQHHLSTHERGLEGKRFCS